MKKTWILPVFFVMILICGCASARVQERQSVDSSLVFGYILRGDAEVPINWLTFRQVYPQVKKKEIEAGVDDGLFFHGNMKPGSYQITMFGGKSGLFIGPFNFAGIAYDYLFSTASDGFRIKEPGMYFLGAFKCVTTKNKLDYVPVDEPTELEVLERLLPYAKDTKWAEQINKRIKKLEAKK